MQLSEATKLAKIWGNKPCSHPSLEKEYFGSADTGDKVCTVCGKAVYDFMGREIGPEKSKKSK